MLSLALLALLSVYFVAGRSALVKPHQYSNMTYTYRVEIEQRLPA